MFLDERALMRAIADVIPDFPLQTHLEPGTIVTDPGPTNTSRTITVTIHDAPVAIPARVPSIPAFPTFSVGDSVEVLVVGLGGDALVIAKS